APVGHRCPFVMVGTVERGASTAYWRGAQCHRIEDAGGAQPAGATAGASGTSRIQGIAVAVD
ncbi:hypothetical protein ABTD73_20195, partial [Acinetobacter baumannii]